MALEFKSLFLISILISTSIHMSAQNQELDPSRLKLVEDMAYYSPDDTMYLGLREKMGDEEYDAMKMTMEQRQKEKDDFILNTPGITPYLFDLLERGYEKHSTNFISFMVAISKRNDLTTEDINKITFMMNGILSTPADELNASREAIYLIGGVIILRKFPSPENEDLAIRVLNRTDHRSWDFGKLAAAETLALIGTPKSLPQLEDARRWAESNSEGDDFWKDIVTRMKSYNRDLKRRLENTGRTHSSTASRKPGHVQDALSTTAEDKNSRTNLHWLFLLLGCLGSILAAFAYRRTRTT